MSGHLIQYANANNKCMQNYDKYKYPIKIIILSIGM